MLVEADGPMQCHPPTQRALHAITLNNWACFYRCTNQRQAALSALLAAEQLEATDQGPGITEVRLWSGRQVAYCTAVEAVQLFVV